MLHPSRSLPQWWSLAKLLDDIANRMWTFTPDAGQFRSQENPPPSPFHFPSLIYGSTDLSSTSRTRTVQECHGNGGSQYATFWDGLFSLDIILGRVILLLPVFLKFLPFSSPGTSAKALRLYAPVSSSILRNTKGLLLGLSTLALGGGRGRIQGYTRTGVPLEVVDAPCPSGPDALQGWALTATCREILVWLGEELVVLYPKPP